MKNVLAITTAALALVAAGCGSDNKSSGSSSGSGSGSSSSSAAPSSAAQSSNIAVDIKGFAFTPKDLTVKKGTKITWTNDDSAAHNVTAGDNTFTSKTLNQGDTFTWTADKAGQWDYVCTFHANMTAHITVTG